MRRHELADREWAVTEPLLPRNSCSFVRVVPSWRTRLRGGIEELLQFLKHKKHAEQYVVVFDDISRLARDIRIHLDLRDAVFATGAQIDCPSVEFRQDSDGLYFKGIQALGAEYFRRKNAVNGHRMVLKLAFAERPKYDRNWGFRAPKTA